MSILSWIIWVLLAVFMVYDIKTFIKSRRVLKKWFSCEREWAARLTRQDKALMRLKLQNRDLRKSNHVFDKQNKLMLEFLQDIADDKPFLQQGRVLTVIEHEIANAKALKAEERYTAALETMLRYFKTFPVVNKKDFAYAEILTKYFSTPKAIKELNEEAEISDEEWDKMYPGVADNSGMADEGREVKSQ